MNNRNTIQEELKLLNSSLAEGPALHAYQVPEGYFENLHLQVLDRIHKEKNADDPAEELASVSPFLAAIPRINPYSVPQGYFESNMEVLPLMYAPEPVVFGKPQPSYSVPDGYFETLPQQLLDRVKEKKQAKVVNIGQKWARFAVAAMIAGILTITGIRYFGGTREIPVDSPQWVSQKLKNVSAQASDDFVKSTAVNNSNTASLTRSKSTDDRRILKDVSDSELDNFLEQLPVDEELGIN
jgi:hypothetical protein